MRDIQQLLREKEDSIEQIRREIEALRSVSMLLLDAAPKCLQVSGCEEPKTELLLNLERLFGL